MAWFSEAGAGGAVNVAATVGAEVSNISRNGTNLSFNYRAYIYQSGSEWSVNTWALWIEGTQYNVKDRSQSSYGTKYYTPWRSKSVTLGASTSSVTIGIGVNGNVWSPTSPADTIYITLYDAPTASAPSVSALTISNVKDKSASASFSVTSSNNSTVTSNQIQLSTSNFGSVIKTINGTSGIFSDLDANRTYYARGKSVNGVGTTYTGVKSFKTSYTNPGAPGQPVLSYDQSSPIPKAKLKATWTVASNGSTPVAGYRIRLFKNDYEVFMIDTESTALTYEFDTFENLGFKPGDVAKVGIYAYSKDWNGDRHWNGGGTTEAQVYSSSNVTVVSDKFIYVSYNGTDFAKRKIFVSYNGGDFIEIKKEKIKVIK